MSRAFLASLLIFCISAVHAHRINVFAYIEGERIFVEARLKSTPARNADVTLQDASGKAMATGKTSDEGKCEFTIPSSGPLTVVVDAGEGHRGQWKLEAGESLSTPAAIMTPAPTIETAPIAAIDEAALQIIVERALEKKLAPIRQLLIDQQMREPGWREALAGLGWIAAMVGVAMAYLARKKYMRR